MKNVSVIQLLKDKCASLCGKDYLPYLCYNIEMNSFYVVCHIWKNSNKIIPIIKESEMQEIIQHPLGLKSILKFNQKKISNLCIWLLGKLPILIFISTIWIVGKLKHIL